MTTSDPLVQFADRDQAVRARLDLIEHRSYTRPHFYAHHGDYLRDKVAALRAKTQLARDMVVSVPPGVLRSVLEDAHVAALTEQQQWEDRLRSYQEAEQTAAYVTYRDNLRTAA